MHEAGQKYRPSNGSEGVWFETEFCSQCRHMHPDPDKKPACDIWARAFLCSVNDPEYPAEWQYDDQDEPTCTKFSHHEWEMDEDENWIDPPEPEIVDPNQLSMFPDGENI